MTWLTSKKIICVRSESVIHGKPFADFCYTISMQVQIATTNKILYTLPENDIAPENQRLEDESLCGIAYLQRLC